MPGEPYDLWPSDLGRVKQRTPAAILQEQGAVLGRRTSNLVIGRVVPESGLSYVLPPDAPPIDEEQRFSYSFDLVAPALDHYHFKLFSFTHGIINFYPVHFILGRPEMTRWASSEAEFVTVVREILNLDHTKRVIDSLIAQSQVPV